jgi:hypothetical protein
VTDLVFQFQRDDTEFRNALKTEFGDKAAIAEVKSFDGTEYLQAIVTVVLPLAPFVVDFLIGYLRERKKRIVLTPDHEIEFDNYSIDEAKELLLKIANEEQDN